MAETNSDEQVVDDDKQVTEDDLRELKYPKDDVENSQEADEPSEGDDTEEESEDTAESEEQISEEATDEEEADEAETPPAFVKEFDFIKGDTPEEYAKNLELAYRNSTSEALRLKDELKAVSTVPAAEPPAETGTEEQKVTPLSPLELFAQQEMDDKITSAFAQFQVDYPQVATQANYDAFTRKVATLSKTILDTENRLAGPEELYGMAAVSLKWEKADATPDSKDKLGMALKDKAATSKTTSAPGSKPKPSKVSEKMIKVNQDMYPGKTREEIIKELEPYIS